MPTYEYECRSCQHRFEKYQSIAEDPVKVCPACGGSVRRVIGGGMGVIFKGPGFYVTDSRNSKAASSVGGKKLEAGKGAKAEAAPAAEPAAGTKSSEPASSAAPAEKEKA